MSRTTAPSVAPTAAGGPGRPARTAAGVAPARGGSPATAPAAGHGVRPPAVGTVTAVRRAARAELLKVLTLRSTRAAVLVAMISLVVLAAFMAVGSVVQEAPPDPSLSAADVVLGATVSGVTLAFYAAATLGVIAVTGEYASGTIRSTLAAVPRRGVLVAGKALAVVTVVLASTLVAAVLALVTVRLVLASGGVPTATDPAVTARVVVGTALHLSVVALVGSGFGWLLHSTAGAIASVVGLLVVLPALAFLLPRPVADVVRPFLPDVAGAAVYQPVPDLIGPWTGFAVFAAYAAVVLLAGAAAVRRRDV
ncbi:ABC transporter permease [Cellulomonas aerilata]|uniref:ABC transporter permease n=1 Tax=Cellulomonas aerilata TaxID=515326 RepID=A0A512D9V5_9CELL|nr:ABC transporter permease subunit [Cellulomonas aerilata]GEO33249.1 ABC transporter permease [Cellulomonas aerilata]